jgi:hypothetical protein
MKDVQEVENKESVETAAPEVENQQVESTDLNLNDLAVLRNIVDVASQRGAFKAAELEPVGKIYNKLSAFLDNIAAKKEQA